MFHLKNTMCIMCKHSLFMNISECKLNHIKFTNDDPIEKCQNIQTLYAGESFEIELSDYLIPYGITYTAGINEMLVSINIKEYDFFDKFATLFSEHVNKSFNGEEFRHFRPVINNKSPKGSTLQVRVLDIPIYDTKGKKITNNDICDKCRCTLTIKPHLWIVRYKFHSLCGLAWDVSNMRVVVESPIKLLLKTPYVERTGLDENVVKRYLEKRKQQTICNQITT